MWRHLPSQSKDDRLVPTAKLTKYLSIQNSILYNNHADQVPGFNLLRAEFFRGNKNIYLYFMSFLNIDMTQVVEIILDVRQECTYSA